MTDKSDIFFDCPYVRVIETEKTLFGYWYKVFARCGELAGTSLISMTKTAF